MRVLEVSHTRKRCFKEAKAVGKIKNEKATMLFNSGIEIVIIDTTIDRKMRCSIDESRTQECVGIGECLHGGGTGQDQGRIRRIASILFRRMG